MGSFPQVGVKIKEIETTTQSMCFFQRRHHQADAQITEKKNTMKTWTGDVEGKVCKIKRSMVSYINYDHDFSKKTNISFFPFPIPSKSEICIGKDSATHKHRYSIEI